MNYLRNGFHGNGCYGMDPYRPLLHEVMGVILIQPIKFIFSRWLSCQLIYLLSYQVTKLFRNSTNGPYSHVAIYVLYHEFSKKFCLHKNIIVNITAYSAIISVIATCLIKNVKIRSFSQKFSPTKILDYTIA